VPAGRRTAERHRQKAAHGAFGFGGSGSLAAAGGGEAAAGEEAQGAGGGGSLIGGGEVAGGAFLEIRHPPNGSVDRCQFG